MILNNEIAGFKFGTVGVLYAVVLGMAVVAVWSGYDDANATALHEASMVGALWRDAEGLPEDGRRLLRGELERYTRLCIEIEWPLLKDRKSSPEAQEAYENLFSILLSFEPKSMREQVVLTETFRRLNSLGDQRRARMIDSESVMPGLLWAALLVGGAVTVVFTFFFGARNARSMALMTALLSGFIAMLLIVVYEIDHCYSGSARIEPTALRTVLAQMEADGAL